MVNRTHEFNECTIAIWRKHMFTERIKEPVVLCQIKAICYCLVARDTTRLDATKMKKIKDGERDQR